ncbi:hypothetical protein OEZ86_010650 [Tetradesmus obliquus]|nr:hypothetical protein OEZ86_010650 [Tetradesmus obliquus]
MDSLLLPGVLDQCGCFALAQLVWGLGLLGHTHTGLFAACLDRFMQRQHDIDRSQQPANVLYGAAKAEWQMEPGQAQQLLAALGGSPTIATLPITQSKLNSAMATGRPKPAARSKLLLVTLAACILGSLPSAVHAHASLTTPRSRNEAFFNNWYANGGNGLGPRPFRPAGSPGVCGDPYQEVSPASNMATFQGPVTAYQSGQTIRVSVRLQVNHGGRLTFRLCDRKTNLDQGCFNARTLVRADNGKPHWYILTGSWEGTNAGRPEFANIDLRLPAGFSCPGGCVLQMEYYTYNSCVEQCPREDCGFYADRMNRILPVNIQGPKDICRTGGTQEIFLNCADIVITGSSGPTPPGPTPPGPTPPGPTPPPPTCNDNRADCTAWGPGLCSNAGVRATCPCMCRSGATPPGPTPPGPTPPGPTPPPPTCNDNRADCTAWGPGLCSTPGVATTCPCMCRTRTARAARRAARRIGGQAAAAAAAAVDPATVPADTSVASAAASAAVDPAAAVDAAAAVDPAAAAVASSTEVPPLSVVHLSPAPEPAAAEGAAGAAP